MNYKFVILFFSFFLLIGCNQLNQQEKKIVFNTEQKYKNTGFALVYNDKLKKK